MTIAERLRAWREASGLSQEEAARVFPDASLAAYRKWESGEVEPTGKEFRNRDAVAKVLDRFEGVEEEVS